MSHNPGPFESPNARANHESRPTGALVGCTGICKVRRGDPSRGEDMRKLVGAFLILLVAACAENTTTAVSGSEPVKTYPAHGRQVRIVRGELPPGTDYEVLGKVKAIEGWYGELAQAERKIAESARAIGADAVIEVKVWHAPRLGTWAAPHAEGVAIKLRQPESLNLDTVPGNWY
jgi:hypothetical protein